METNFKIFREKVAISPNEMAARLNMNENEYRDIEDGIHSPSYDFVPKFCEAVQVDPNTFLNYKAPKPENIQVGDVYGEMRFRKRLLDSYLKPAIECYKVDEYTKSEVNRVDELYSFIDLASAKPVIAFVGPSDAGKSTLINVITGVDALLSQWTPTTSATVLLKHVDDKPSWMNSDDVWIFKAESKKQGWDFRRFNDYEYCNAHQLARGDLSILTEYCNRNSSDKSKQVDSAVVFLNSELLKACDIIDLPGFGTESYSENIQAQRAKEKADIVVFLCQANGFLNKKEDVIFLKDVIHQMPNIRINEKDEPLLNLLVVATQAHHVGEKNLPSIHLRGKEVLSEQLSNDVIMERFEMEKEEFVYFLGKRFLSYSIENSLMRKGFEVELKHILSEIIPTIRNQIMDKGIAQFKAKTKKELGQQINKYESILEDRSEALAEYQIKNNNRDSFVGEVNKQKDRLSKLIKDLSRSNLQDVKIWEANSVTPKSIECIIKDKQYDKKKAQEYIASNVADLYLAKTSELVKISVLEFQVQVENAIMNLECSIEEWDTSKVGRIQVPFDVKGAWVGGLAGAGLLGALGLSAASFGNLGGYILVAKGVSVLSALGISVGGTAAASSFVAAIGGPITIGVALSVGALLLIKKIFGEKWETRLATQVHEVFKKKRVLEQYQEKINQLWDETSEALDNVTQNIIQKYDEELNSMRNIINTQDEEELKIHIGKYRKLRDFFDKLPWGGSDIYFLQQNILDSVDNTKQSTFNNEDIKDIMRESLHNTDTKQDISSIVEDALNEKLKEQKDISDQTLKKVINETIESTISRLKKEKVSFTNNQFFKNEHIREKMFQGISEAEKEINIISPWIGRFALDSEMTKLIEKALKRKVVIKILYGMNENSSSNSNDGMFNKNIRTDNIAQELQRKFGNKGMTISKGNTHEKLFICDDKFYMLSSLNMLSKKPTENSADEVAEYSEDPIMIQKYRSEYFKF